MTQFRRLLFIMMSLALGALLAACSGAGNTSNARSSVERDDDMATGNPDAKVVIVEYASLTCPHCATFHQEVFPALKSKYIDTGKIRFIFRQFPTAPAPYAVAGEAVARCAGPDKYFDILDVLYEKQRYWVSNNARQALMEIAATAGISQTQFDACVADEANIKRIQDVVNDAQGRYNISGTPSFVINGKLRPQVRVAEDFYAILDPILGIDPEPAQVENNQDENNKAENNKDRPSGETGEH